MVRDFEKPACVEPPPLREWLDRVDRAETGREPFFVGRDREFDAFFRAVRLLARGEVGGDTLIYQGAPGAGKTGFMQECMVAVRQHSTSAEPWVAVEIKPGTLVNAADTVHGISQAVDAERYRLQRTTSHARALGAKAAAWLRRAQREVSVRGAGVAGARIGPDSTEDRTAVRHFSDAAARWRGVRLVVFVDESQNIPRQDAARDVLDCIHRGVDGIAMLGVFLGLSDTADVLADCGISRPGAERLFELCPLSEEETKDSVRAMFDAYGIDGVDATDKESRELRDRWVNALAETSQGWPQHLSGVTVAAAREALEARFDLAEASLPAALAGGEAAKTAYYDQRLGRAMPWPGLYKSVALAARPADGAYSLSKDDIETLAAPVLAREGVGLEEFLRRSLHAGVLAPTGAARIAYRVPIPSFARYLRELPVEAVT